MDGQLAAFAPEIISDIAINCQNVKFSKLGFADTPCPTTPSLEKAFFIHHQEK